MVTGTCNIPGTVDNYSLYLDYSKHWCKGQLIVYIVLLFITLLAYIFE